jgi:imidazolonepropionase-like amidohydrolase|tara:strand:+ start:740 stop:2065 length:1326 start_codon:yes stop_codon:yes gene_type:complete
MHIDMKKITLLSFCFFLFTLGFAQTPAKNQSKRIMLYGATAHIGNGDIIENSLIVIENGKITSVEDATHVRIDISNAEYFDVIGKHIYPGFILPNTTLGLADIDAVRATRDFDEVGELNPHIRSIIAYNTDSPVLPTIRTNGILVGQITPKGGMISGTSSIVEFDAWNYEDALYKEDDGVHLNWPRKPWLYGDHEHAEKSKDHFTEDLIAMEEFFEKAKAYYLTNKPQLDISLQAMEGLFDGSKQLFIHVSSTKGIKQAVLFSQKMGIKKMVLVGAEESWRIADFIAENEIPVILNRVHRLPRHKSDAVDVAFKTPKILQDAGVLYCLDYEGDMERMGSRNLPFTAGTAVTYGLTKEEALMTITLNTAKILGIDARLGSLEIGKDATLFVSDGDALDMMTNKLSHAFIRGKRLDLNNHQLDLYEKYKAKYKAELEAENSIK